MKQMTACFFTSLLLLVIAIPALATSSGTPDGTFTATLDPASFTLTPVGANCLLTVQGALTFSGRLIGEATGMTSALVFADCGAVQANPPGAFPDVFRSELTFTGTINGTSVTDLGLIYQGQTAVGGDIRGQMHLDNGRQGVLSVAGIVAQGGSYWFQTP
jgi:hypothetical protein